MLSLIHIYNAQYGKKQGDLELRGGIVRNKLGIGASYGSKRWRFDADLFNPNDLTMRLKACLLYTSERRSVYFILP